MAFDRVAYHRKFKKAWNKKEYKLKKRNPDYPEWNERRERYIKETNKKRASHPNVKAYRAKYRAGNPDKFKLYSKRKQFADRSRQELAAPRLRPTNCEACGRFGPVVFDHDHETITFRSWVCRKCNTTMGQAEDKSWVLRKLADIIDEHRATAGDQVQLQTCANSSKIRKQ